MTTDKRNPRRRVFDDPVFDVFDASIVDFYNPDSGSPGADYAAFGDDGVVRVVTGDEGNRTVV